MVHIKIFRKKMLKMLGLPHISPQTFCWEGTELRHWILESWSWVR